MVFVVQGLYAQRMKSCKLLVKKKPNFQMHCNIIFKDKYNFIAFEPNIGLFSQLFQVAYFKGLFLKVYIKYRYEDILILYN